MSLNLINAEITKAEITADSNGVAVILEFKISVRRIFRRVETVRTFLPSKTWIDLPFYINRLLVIAGVLSWSELKGRPVRILLENNRVEEVHHYLEDEFATPVVFDSLLAMEENEDCE